jgi:TPR repeat protein
VLLAVLLLAGIAGTIFLQARARHNATPKSPELAKPVSADVATPQTETPSATENAQNDASAPGPVNSSDADQHPRQPETSEGESKTANAATPADTPAKERDTKGTDTKEDNQPVESAAIKKSTRKGNGGKEKLAEEPKPSVALVNAQRYLQGKGVRQNCAQGLQYLKTATEQKDPEATVQMAALYASGHCVRQDRVQAYKWFTSASELQPSNHWIEKNLNWLWADMTSAERQQISK